MNATCEEGVNREARGLESLYVQDLVGEEAHQALYQARVDGRERLSDL
ncbi:hypothetical protein QQM79_00060 [Marinobacteraceae bacterium S3BR75-40.1]